jgi:FtsP/CotA-like multicopper oxidase with cupredoxin domain
MSFFRLLAIGFILTTASAVLGESIPPASSNDNRTSAGILKDRVLSLRLEVCQAKWFPEEDGKANAVVDSFAEEGHPPQIPGPLIRVPEGTEISANIHNLLNHTIYVHGLGPRLDADKVQPPPTAEILLKQEDPNALEIAAGGVREVRFNPGPAGSYYYWASPDRKSILLRPSSASLLSGALIVDRPGALPSDRVFVINIYLPNGNIFKPMATINGKSWPYTERITAQAGDSVRWRWINTSNSDHAMHLHGFYFQMDGTGDQNHFLRSKPNEPQMVVTHETGPGETFDMTWTPERLGHWVMHCHMTIHMMIQEPLPGYTADSHYTTQNAGMGGMVLGVNVVAAKNDPGRSAAVKPVAAVRKLRLDVRERPATRRSTAGYSFDQGIQGHETSPEELPVVGEPLVLTRGEPTEIEVVNKLKEPTAVHWHGIEIESYYDGVPGWTGTRTQTTPPIAPGSSFVVHINPPRAGTFIYHTHWHQVKQLGEGLTGPLIVLEPGERYDPSTDKSFLFTRDGAEGTEPLLMNGSSQPEPIDLTVGTKYRLRFINITPVDSDLTYSFVDSNGTPVQWRAIAKDGHDLTPEQAVVKDAKGDSITVGETRDYSFTPQKPGELFLQAAAFPRMWVRTTFVVSAAPQLRSADSPSAALLRQWNEIGRKLTAMAEDFPEDKYDFKPTPTMRSFAERMLHAAGANYYFTNTALKRKLPGDDPPRSQFKDKAAIVVYVKNSFADGAAAIKSLGDQGVAELVVDPFGFDDPQHAGQAQIRLGELAQNLIEHCGEIYGNLSVYYRLAGLIPPESRPK